MARAVNNLARKIKIDAVFVDGKFTLPKTGVVSYAVIKGDSKIPGIAVASIIAKDFRDHFMINNYGELYAAYHIAQNKGYRSPDHLMSIRKMGPVEGLHRTYLPQIKKVLSGNYDSVIFSKYRDRWERLNECQAA
jgi:ribonuclease HII